MGSKTLPVEHSRAWLTSLAAKCLDVASEEIEAQVPLSQYGMDSLAQIQLSTAIEISVGRSLPDSFLCDHQDIASIERFLNREEDPTATSSHSDSMPSAYLERMRADSSLPRDIQPSPGTLNGDNPDFVLLTGATGFLGGYLLSTLLRETTATVLCLVRSSGKSEGQNRIQQNLKSFGLWEPGLETRIRVIPGDVSRPRLGWSKRQYQELSKQVNVIHHAAADVNWVYPYSQLREVNVQGTLNLLRLASLNKSKPFHFISSLAVCYSTSGPREVSEEDQMLAYLDGIHLGYAQSKCVAE
ncbi:MAG: SDR family oxidoreductase, partial [Acidobacteriota bacterium]